MTDSALEQKAVELITNLEKLAEPAMQITLQAVQAGAVLDLALSAACLALLAFVWVRYLPRVLALLKDAPYDAEIPVFIGGVVAAIASVVLGCVALTSLFSTSNWLAVFSPELALARSLIEKAT
jgi:small-conductance mechanosensitive channel